MLTLLALLTGLAAIGTPASAAMGELFGAQVQTRQQDRADERREECRQRRDRERGPARRETARECPPPPPVRIILPTVMLGSDLSLE
ncbi:hypothetical protein LY632_09685 [Erythrobacter sp. SDW2]|uniref:hypothetical protein n=1 Tax=Erythrobacter sp. SDW2 TaxID=2907154 RepID=UPI001F1B90C4|nr:hypothetical protein [Erythrobacter sp. SDW2]UIP05971.1 hypothetical protein LY632_09685 [Erythrobacter sp. SDW2]